MAWSYDSSNLSESTASGRLNIVRLLIGDTDTTDEQIQDEEVLFALSQGNDNVYVASAWACRVLASKYSRMVDTSLDGALSTKYSDLSKQYTTRAESLEYQGKKSSAAIGILAGGITKTSINAVRANTDRVEGSFRRDRFHNPPSYETPEYE